MDVNQSAKTLHYCTQFTLFYHPRPLVKHWLWPCVLSLLLPVLTPLAVSEQRAHSPPSLPLSFPLTLSSLLILTLADPKPYYTHDCRDLSKRSGAFGREGGTFVPVCSLGIVDKELYESRTSQCTKFRIEYQKFIPASARYKTPFPLPPILFDTHGHTVRGHP